MRRASFSSVNVIVIAKNYQVFLLLYRNLEHFEYIHNEMPLDSRCEPCTQCNRPGSEINGHHHDIRFEN